jgi:long-chain acyl-CoA synthetase
MALTKDWPAMSVAEAHRILTAPGARFEMAETVIRGVPTRIWKNAPATLRDVFIGARAFGPRDFLVYERERATYEGFSRAVLTLAEEFSRRGVVKGDRIAMVMRNLPEWPVVFFAAVSVGAIVAPLNAWWTAPELDYGLKDCGAKIAVLDGERLDRLGERLADCPALERVYVSRALGNLENAARGPLIQALESVIGPVSAWETLAEVEAPSVRLEPDDEATLFYTSGTTGSPKGALGTHRNMCTNIGTAGVAAARSYLRRGETPPTPDPTVQRTTLLVVPMFHVTGCSATLCPAIAAGSKIVLMRRWDAAAALRLIQEERVNATGGVPTIAWQLIEHPERANYDLSSLDTVTYGGAPSAPELVRRIVETFPKSIPGNGWGMSETTATFTSHLAEDYEHRPDSCGPAAPVGELKVIGPQGETLPVGEVGELCARGPQVVIGYWNKPEATAKTFVDGWVLTGDLARVDEEGFCFIIDRAKDMLIRGGENIYCIEVENVLYDHPAVMDAALVGVPHRTLGEEPAAVVTLKPGATADETEIRDFVAARIAAFKVPVKVLFWTETLPRNANGKILKAELKKLFADPGGDQAALRQ